MGLPHMGWSRTLAKMRNTSASCEFVIHIFEPLIIQWSPSFVARVWRANASDPEAGSDKQKLPSYRAVRQRMRGKEHTQVVNDEPSTLPAEATTSPVVPLYRICG